MSPDFKNQIVELTGSGTLYTATKMCWLFAGPMGINRYVRVNNQGVGDGKSVNIILQVGDVVTCSANVPANSDTNSGLGVYEILK